MYRELSNHDPSLRPYQQKAKDDIFAAWDECNCLMFQMPTGTGKTRLFTSLIHDIKLWLIGQGTEGKVLIIAHRVELIDQISSSLQRYDIAHGVIAGGKPRNLSPLVQVASIQTITHHSNLSTAQIMPVEFLIIDEAHHSMANSYRKLWALYPDSKKLGVTATPWRMNEEGFTSLYDRIIESAPVSRFIAEGWLSPYSYYSIAPDSETNRSINHINEFDSEGDYKVAAMERTIDTLSIRAQLLKSYLSLARGKKGIIYSISRRHSDHICSEYRAAGINIVRIDSLTSRSERQLYVDRFKKGLIDIIVNVDIFSEGFDCPDIEFIQLARPTRSLVKYLQQVGRGLRPAPDKRKCMILDNVGAHLAFGFPDSERNWTEFFRGHSPSSLHHKKAGQKSHTSSNDMEQENKSFEEGTEDLLLVEDIASTETAPPSFRWSASDTALLRQLKEQRHCTNDIIAQVFNCSTDEVDRMLKEMGLGT